MDASGEEENVLMFKDVHLCQSCESADGLILGYVAWSSANFVFILRNYPAKEKRKKEKCKRTSNLYEFGSQ